MLQNFSQFQKATEMFYSMQYEQGLNLINQCIDKDPTNSILYSNRALFYSQVGCIQEALLDLNSALELNYLNYIAYFNLFSLLMRIQKFDEAFQNLCCSLSCLYLIRAKTKKSEIDASKSIKYAQNNIEAHVLKGLIHLENGKYKLALNELDWACEINPFNHVIKNIRNLIYKKMNPGLPNEQIQNQNITQQKEGFIRLQSSYIIEQADKQKQLRDKILQFNEIYNNLNEYQGTITTKVPKEEQNQPDVDPKKESQPHQNINQSQKYGNQSNTNNETQIVEQNSFQVSNAEQHNNLSADNLILNENNNQELSSQRAFQREQRQEHFEEGEQVFVADGGVATPSKTSYAPQPGQYLISQHNHFQESVAFQGINQKQFHSISNKDTENENTEKELQNQSDHFSQFKSMINSQHESQIKIGEENFQSFVTDNQNEVQSLNASTLSNALYPKPKNSMLQITIMKAQINDRSKQEILEMKNIYCIANYINGKQGNMSNFKLRTACQKGFNNGTEWNQTFDPIQIPQNPECMKIKIYNKKYSSYRDDLIGQLQVQISTHGQVKLPLFNRKGDLSGSIFINLELVFSPISQISQVDEGEQN